MKTHSQQISNNFGYIQKFKASFTELQGIMDFLEPLIIIQEIELLLEVCDVALIVT